MPRWLPWAAVFLLAPMLFLFSVLVDLALGGKLPALPLGAPSAAVFAAAFGSILISGGGMEEVGWRGFALPRLQKFSSPLAASLIIGVVWALWHLPLYFNGQYTSGSNTGPAALAGILFRFEWSLPLSVVFTWVYNHARGSLLIMILFHTVLDWTTAVVPISYRAGAITFMGTFWVVAIVVTLVDHMWRKPQLDSATPWLPPRWQPSKREWKSLIAFHRHRRATDTPKSLCLTHCAFSSWMINNAHAAA